MPETLTSRAGKVALPPGTLVHVGRRKDKPARIDVLTYNEKTFEQNLDVASSELAAHVGEIGKITWVRVQGVHDLGVIKHIGEVFKLHPLVQEDVANTFQRPKLEDYGDYLFVVMRILILDRENIAIKDEQVCVVMGKNYVVSFQEGPEDTFDPVVQRITDARGRIRQMGPDYLAYALIDTVVDNYFLLEDDLTELLDSVEERVLEEPDKKTLELLHRLRRIVLLIRKPVWQSREFLLSLSRGESSLLSQEIGPFFRDVYDHLVHVSEGADNLRETFSILLDIYLNNLNNRLNEVIRWLTAVATIFMPLTFVTSLYGMNFKYMPELHWQWGYPAVLALMFAASVVMVIYFRRKNWL